MHSFVRDLRFRLRQLRLNPTFTAVAVLSLALGIGANSAIFQLIDAIRMRTLPVEKPQELAYVDMAKDSWRMGWSSTRNARLTYALWESIRDRQEGFSGMLAWSATRFNLAEGGRARYAEGMFVNGEFFHVLGVPAEIGRTLAAEDDRLGCGYPGAVISHAFWQQEFQGDPGVANRKVRLDGKLFPMSGVSRLPGFFGVEIRPPLRCRSAFVRGPDVLRTGQEQDPGA